MSAAEQAFVIAAAGSKPFQRIEIPRRLAELVRGRHDHFSHLIAEEGGKPITDARIEVDRAIDGIGNAADELRNFTGREIPMGLTAASDGRWAFTTKEPIGVVFAISAFNHPLNLIVHQLTPAIAVGCPVVVKPASATPLCCLEFVELVRGSRAAGAVVPEFRARADRPGRASGHRSAHRFPQFHRIGQGRLAAARHAGSGHAVARWSMAVPHPRSLIAAPISSGLSSLLVKGGYYHAGQVCVD